MLAARVLGEGVGAAARLARALSGGAAAQALAQAGSQLEIFDGPLKAAHRDRAALYPLEPDPLLDEVSERLLDRLEDCRRSFHTAAILGGAGAQVAARLAGGRARIQRVLHVDTSQAQLDRAQAAAESSSSGSRPHAPTEYILWPADREVLPLEPASVDVVISCLGLHWVNDVPGVMAQCRLALKPDGLFLGAMLGGLTLQELRIACTLAQQEREGGVSARTSPVAQVRDAGNLLTRAGLGIPAVDVDEIEVGYSDPVQLVGHLRRMGEVNGVARRQAPLHRDTALAAAAAYATLFGGEAAEPGESKSSGVPATFQVIYMTGWAPHESHQKAKSRGSATVSFEELSRALGEEQPQPPQPGG